MAEAAQREAYDLLPTPVCFVSPAQTVSFANLAWRGLVETPESAAGEPWPSPPPDMLK